MRTKLNMVKFILAKKFHRDIDWENNIYYCRAKMELFYLTLSEHQELIRDAKKRQQFFRKIEQEMFVIPSLIKNH